MVRNAIDRNRISVGARLMQGMIPVRGDRVQLQQVVLNLILNSVEGMSSVEEGARKLSISTKQGETGDFLVAVQDSGPGIDPENLERVFAAFYTTKASGLGMGLSICRSIVAAMAVVCGQRAMSRGARSFGLRCPRPNLTHEHRRLPPPQTPSAMRSALPGRKVPADSGVISIRIARH